MSGLGTKQQCHTSYGSKSVKQTLTLSFKEEKLLNAPLFTEIKMLNLTNVTNLNNCILVFDHLNSSLPAIFDDFFKPFKEQHSHNTRGERRYVLNIEKMKIFFYGSRSVQVKSVKD